MKNKRENFNSDDMRCSIIQSGVTHDLVILTKLFFSFGNLIFD